MLKRMWVREIVPGVVIDLLRRCAVRRGLKDFVDRPLDRGGDGFLDARRSALVVHDLIDVTRVNAEVASDATDRLPASD